MDLDVRCAARFGSDTNDDERLRCQLFAGHDADHALVANAAGNRQLTLWRGARVSHSSLADGVPYQLPWSRGCTIVVDLDPQTDLGAQTDPGVHTGPGAQTDPGVHTGPRVEAQLASQAGFAAGTDVDSKSTAARRLRAIA